MHADPAALSRQLGVELHHFGLDEFVALVQSQPDEVVENDVAHVLALGLPFGEDTGPDDLVMNSRYYLAMDALVRKENLAALAVRCWPELPGRLGAWPYLAMSRLAEENRAVALEGDVDGAVSCLVGGLLGIGPGYISDWLEHDEHTITLWHPGHAPPSLCAPGSVRLGRHFNTGHPLVVHATLAPDLPVTLFRLWRCDGQYRMMACEANTAAPRRELSGAHGLARVGDRHVPTWFDHLCHEGMPHHVIVFRGHHAELLERFARLLRVDWADSTVYRSGVRLADV
jgi:L-fucose isomerase-like protein